MDKVSILVPTYNRKFLLRRTLQSLITQSWSNIEILVVNDGGESVDDVIESFGDERIRYFTNEKNIDLGATRNVALKNSTGQYLCLLDDDDVYLPYTIEFRMFMIKKLNVEIVYSRSLQDIWEKTSNGYVSKGKQLYWDSPFDKDLILIQNISPCCCPLFSRKAWEQSGYWFKENLTTSEDWDFWVHLSRNNNFHELKLVDCECSYRLDNSQMTGSRTGFTDHLPELYREWRKFAKDKKLVKELQNKALMGRGINPKDYYLE